MSGCHRIFLASAGTGKTFRLSGRMLDLLLSGVESRSILATTFTRKAAQEILERVLERLVEMIDTAEARADLAELRDFGGQFDAEEVLTVLTALVRGLDRFEVRTLDSFFIHLGRLFTLEAGLPPQWSVGHGPDAEQVRTEALSRLLSGVHGPEQEEQFAELLRELASADGAARAIHASLAALVDGGRDVFLDSDADAWTVLKAPPLPDAAAADALAARLGALAVPNTAAGKPNSHWVKAQPKLIDALAAGDLEALSRVGLFANYLAGNFKFGRAPIEGEWLEVLADLQSHAAARALGVLAVRNKRAFELLSRYEALLQAVKREHGLYEFADIPRALAPDPGGGHEPIAGCAFDLAYRLDAHLHHLLLDEFQDTAPAQWRVLDGLAEEICADGSGKSSFFCVGDVKQSIYGWRSAEPRLLGTLGEHLHVEPEPLHENHRSSAVILATVDQVFSSIGSLAMFAAAGKETHKRAAERFGAQYGGHSAAKTLPGVAELRQAPAAGDGQSKWQPVMDLAVQRVAAIAEECPRATIGVLVRSNKVIPPLIAKLQRKQVLASGEGGNPLTDSAAVLHFLSLMHLADHPSDSLAAFHLVGSPFPGALGCSDPRADAAGLARAVRARLATEGLGPLCAVLDEAVRDHDGYSDWDRRRHRQLVDLAFARSDQAGLRADGFVEFVRKHKVEDPAAARVKVMTVHAAKGLEFDAVVLPELHGALTTSQWMFLTKRPDPREKMAVVTVNPGKAIAGLDAGLTRLFEEQSMRAVEEALCVLYVGMTRAKHRLEMLVPDPGNGGGGTTPAGILRAALPDDDSDGDPDGDLLWRHPDSADVWLPPPPKTGEPKDADTPAPAPDRVALNLAASVRLRQMPGRSPSSEVGEHGVSGAALLAPRSAHATRRGSLVHRLLEEMEWPGDGSFDTGALVDVGADIEPDEARRRSAIDYVEEALTADEIRAALTPPSEGAEAEVWREREFCVVIDDDDGKTQRRGSFDRVVLWQVDGKPVRATIQDYKTDAVSGDDVDALVEKYAPQLQAYRVALHAMTDLPLEVIETELLLLSPGLVRSVPAP